MADRTLHLTDHGTTIPLERVAEVAGRLERELAKAIIGQQRVVREILIAFLAGGHCLLRGVPGLAKTLLIKKLAEAVDLKFNRIQFTPDLMPSDILGAEVIEEDRATGKRVIRFIQGPIFANIILADEINRTPPKTQAALLEAMQEYQVTVNGVRFDLERPLFVLATQNPIEQEGTYPLPEAQLDRFMFNVVIEYPSADEERRILAATTGTRRSEDCRGRDRRGDRAAALGRPRGAGGRERHRLRHAARARDAADRTGVGRRARVRADVGALGRRAARRPGAAARRQGARAARRPQRRVARRRPRRRAAGAAAPHPASTSRPKPTASTPIRSSRACSTPCVRSGGSPARLGICVPNSSLPHRRA